MKARLLLSIFAVGLIAFGVFLFGKVQKRLGVLEVVAKETEAKAAQQLKKDPPILVSPAPGPQTETLQWTGSLRPEAEVSLGFKIPGKVTEVFVKRGDVVKAGQVLAALDGRDLEAQAAQADAGKRAAEAQRSIAADAWKRAKALQEAGAATEQQVVAASGQTSAITATIEQASAARRYVEVIRGETKLVSPIDGIVVHAPTAPGFVVQMMSPPVVIIQKLENVKFAGHLTDRDAARVQAGMAFSVVSAAGAVVHGKLDAVIPSVDPLTRRVPIEGTLPNADGKLFAGSMVSATVEVPSPPCLSVPLSALLTGNRPAVLVVAGSKLKRQEIEVLRTEGDKLLVTGGLVATDRVVANPGVRFRDGDSLAGPVP